MTASSTGTTARPIEDDTGFLAADGAETQNGAAGRRTIPDWTGAIHRWGFLAILAIFLVLAIYYNISNPLFEAPDELQHAAYVVWLADVHSLPVIDPEQPGPMGQEATQAPLYYWMVATLLGPFPHEPAANLAERNRHANFGEPLRPDNKNRVLHDMRREQWPYQGGSLYIHLARLVSIALAIGTLWAIYRLGRIAFPDRPAIALAMMALVAFTPQFLFLSSSVSNDNLVIPIASWTLVGLAAWLRLPRLPGWGQVGIMGVLLGLAVLAKLSGVLLWPLVAGALLWLAWRSRDVRWLFRAGLLCFAIALAICGWWFVRNQLLYGDVTASQTLAAALGGPREDLPSSLRGILAEFRGFRYSLWALFGWFNILAPQAFYWLVDGMTLLGVLGFCIFLARSLSTYPTSTRQIILMLSAWLCLVVAGVLRWAILISVQGRLAFPALGAAALFLVIGWAELVPRRLRRAVGVVGLATWATWASLCPALVIRPAYALPSRMESLAELPANLSYLWVRYADCCELVGYLPPDQPAHQGDWVPLTLVWRVLDSTDRDYSLFVHARTPDGRSVGQLDTYPGNGMYPTSQWRPGEILADAVAVPLSWEAEPPSLVRFHVGLYDLDSMQRTPALSAQGSVLETVVAGEVALIPFRWPPPQPNSASDAVLGGKIRLSAAAQTQPVLHPGETVTITVQWEALAPIEEDYTGFIHLVSSLGEDVAQGDHPPLGGRFPTRLWDRGAVISDPYRIDLPQDLKEGVYGLWGGLYDASGRRLPALSQATGERWEDDLVPIGTLLIAETE
jgi:4-amino-4-deoxy-L-arabinose transferase-like glycosyltransferase